MLIQDLAFIPMIAILPALSGEGDRVLLDIGIGIGKAAIVLVAIVLLGGRIVPWLMRRVANLGSREVFILMLLAAIFMAALVGEAGPVDGELG